jgi:3',5'-cyclic-AMP phosphodiesterase
MTQIAHLSDLHILEDGHKERQGAARRRLAYLSLGRPESPERRRWRAIQALCGARATGAEHLVITGDLTEDGVDEQFEILADILHSSDFPPARVTLVPGNHDAYADHAAFTRALSGPLRAYRATSTMGAPVYLPGVVLLPMSTAVSQSVTRSAGAIEGVELKAAARAAEDSRLAGAALLLAMHHPPHRRALAPIQWLDGLREHVEMSALLDRYDHAHVLHGHTHLARDRSVRPGAPPRIFSTEAVVESQAPLRLYRARHGRLWPEMTIQTGELSLAMA